MTTIVGTISRKMGRSVRAAQDGFKEMVSGDRQRYKVAGMNLDMTYITPHIIAMGFPASSGLEALWRNAITDVVKVLKENHQDNFRVWNLSEKETAEDLLDHKVKWTPFVDHHPPPLALYCKIIDSISFWLRSSTEHVAVVHCVGGKGRTGTIICAYLFYCNAVESSDEALEFFALKRSEKARGVTQPSQRRYVEYFEKLVRGDAYLNIQPIHLKVITLGPLYTTSGWTLELYDSPYQGKLIYRSDSPVANKSAALWHTDIDIIGDIYVKMIGKSSLMGKKSTFFHVCFHTYFIKETTWKLEIDDFDNLQSGSSFPPDVTLTFHFSKPKSTQPVPMISELQPYVTKYEKKRRDEGIETPASATDHPLVHYGVPKSMRKIANLRSTVDEGDARGRPENTAFRPGTISRRPKASRKLAVSAYNEIGVRDRPQNAAAAILAQRRPRSRSIEGRKSIALTRMEHNEMRSEVVKIVMPQIERQSVRIKRSRSVEGPLTGSLDKSTLPELTQSQRRQIFAQSVIFSRKPPQPTSPLSHSTTATPEHTPRGSGGNTQPTWQSKTVPDQPRRDSGSRMLLRQSRTARSSIGSNDSGAPPRAAAPSPVLFVAGQRSASRSVSTPKSYASHRTELSDQASELEELERELILKQLEEELLMDASPAPQPVKPLTRTTTDPMLPSAHRTPTMSANNRSRAITPQSIPQSFAAVNDPRYYRPVTTPSSPRPSGVVPAVAPTESPFTLRGSRGPVRNFTIGDIPPPAPTSPKLQKSPSGGPSASARGRYVRQATEGSPVTLSPRDVVDTHSRRTTPGSDSSSSAGGFSEYSRTSFRATLDESVEYEIEMLAAEELSAPLSPTSRSRPSPKPIQEDMSVKLPAYPRQVGDDPRSMPLSPRTLRHQPTQSVVPQTANSRVFDPTVHSATLSSTNATFYPVAGSRANVFEKVTVSANSSSQPSLRRAQSPNTSPQHSGTGVDKAPLNDGVRRPALQRSVTEAPPTTFRTMDDVYNFLDSELNQ